LASTRLLVAAFAVVVSAAAAKADPRPGVWHAWMESPLGPVVFGLIFEDSDPLRAFYVNGPDTTEVGGVFFDGPTLVLEEPQYDSSIRARITADGASMYGIWSRHFGTDEAVRLVFGAEYGTRDRYPGWGRSPEDFPKRWSMQLADLPHPSLLELSHTEDGGLFGTPWNSTGDYGVFAGALDGDHLRLSRFIGSHAFLIDAQRVAPDRWEGTFFESGYRQVDVVLEADEQAAGPPTFEQLEGRGVYDVAGRRFPALTGDEQSILDVCGDARAILIEVFASWCPNCHELSQFLEDLVAEYGDDGLCVIGLAFEVHENLEKNRRAIERYRHRYGLTYPVLFGFSDRGQPPRDVFPEVEGTFSYPSVLFLRADGTIVEAHTGFAGSSTGEPHAQVRSDFRAIVEEMLSVDGGPH
jgi:thiol-disulfide isomerase/thioredoxin